MIIAIMGGSCSGKTEMSKLFEEQGVRKVITNTTRARRVDDSDTSYNFITVDSFKSKIDSSMMLEYVEYAGNLYGIDRDSITENCVVVVEPEGCRALKREYGEKVYSIYLRVTEGERERRGLSRGDSLESIRLRQAKDEKLFDTSVRDLADLVLENASKECISNIVNAVAKLSLS